MRFLNVCVCLAILSVAMPKAVAAPLTLVTAHYPPYTVEENGQTKGLAVELVKEAFARMGQEIRIVVAPFPRAIEMLKAGQVDGIFPFAMQQDRKLYARYPAEKLFSDPGALFVRANSDISFDGDFANLAAYSFGMQRGTFQGEAFSQAVQTYKIKVDTALDQEQNVRKLVLGRFDIAIGPRLLVLDCARRANELSNIKLLYSGLTEGDAYVAFSLDAADKREDLLARLDRALRSMRQDGSHQRIFSNPVTAR